MPRTIVRYSAAPAGERVPGLLEVLAQLPDPRRRRGRRYSLVFVLAVATVCALAGARNFLPPTRPREKIADQKPGNPIPLIHHLWHAGPGPVSSRLRRALPRSGSASSVLQHVKASPA